MSSPGQVVERTFTVTQKGVGRPDFSEKVHEGKTIWGYTPEPSESFLFAIAIAMEGGDDRPYSFTMDPIPVGGTIEMLDAFTGLPGIRALVGEDYIIKEIWLNFNQPIRFLMYQNGVGDYSCDCHVPAFATPAFSGLPIGWTRAQTEPISVESITDFTVTNLGAAPTEGKAWVVGFRKIGAYTWY